MGRPRSKRWEFVARMCDENPGTWVLISDKGHAAWPSQISSGRLASFKPPGTYRAMMRKGNGMYGQIYVKRVSEGEVE